MNPEVSLGKEMEHMEKANRRLIVVAVLLAGLLGLALPGPALAQFNSGSSGIHGVFPPEPESEPIPTNYSVLVWNIRTGQVWYCGSYTFFTGLDGCNAGSNPNVTAQIPNIPPGGLSSGIYEFTSVTLTTTPGINRSVAIVGSSPNTPLSILSQTDITVSGNAGYSLYVYARGGDGLTPSGSFPNLSVGGARGGPGGFDGGASGNGSATAPGHGSPGLGPSGGAGGRTDATTIEGLHATSAQLSALNPSLTPLAGGSGGGGGAGTSATPLAGCGVSPTGYAGGSGGGGGGAILLAASGRVTVGSAAAIWLNGGTGGGSVSGCGLGAGGAGGSVRIVATEVTGSGSLIVYGGTRNNGTNPAGGGFVRIESSFNTFTGSIQGAAGGSFISFPTAPIPANLPHLRITALNGTAAPTSPTASLSAPDITFPSAVDAPVTLDVAASNVPLGTTVNIRVAPASGSPSTAVTSGLAGTVASSTAQATVTLPPGAGVVTASATFTVSGGSFASNALPLIDGERPQQVEVVAQADGSSKTFLIARGGARFELGQGLR